MATGQETGQDVLARELEPRIAQLARLLIRRGGGLSRTQLSVLATLRDCGPRRITELAESERITQPSMTVLVSRLEEQGLAKRTPHASDRRAVNVSITPAGLEVLARMTAARAAVLAERLDALDASQQEALRAALPALDRLIDD
jgi:DNA-binding MarR family transcriptional regulator